MIRVSAARRKGVELSQVRTTDFANLVTMSSRLGVAKVTAYEQSILAVDIGAGEGLM